MARKRVEKEEVDEEDRTDHDESPLFFSFSPAQVERGMSNGSIHHGSQRQKSSFPLFCARTHNQKSNVFDFRPPDASLEPGENETR